MALVLVALLAPASAVASYQRVKDPTGKVLGTNGGLVLGLGNGDRFVEAGLCVKGGALGGSAGYYYAAFGGAKPTVQSNARAGEPRCSGDPPAVQTGVADVGAGAATIHGQVDPNGEQTTWSVQWGTDAQYHRDTDSVDAGGGWDAQDVSVELDGLDPGTTYWYRVVASSATGVTYGAGRSFVAG